MGISEEIEDVKITAEKMKFSRLKRRSENLPNFAWSNWTLRHKLKLSKLVNATESIFYFWILAFFTTFLCVEIGLIDLHDFRCVSVVLIKAFSVLVLHACVCLSAIFLLYKRIFPLDQNVMQPLLMVFVLIVRRNSQIYWMEGFLLITKSSKD